MTFFEQYEEFVSNDIRKSRGTTQVTAESLDKRCEALLPKWMVEGKTILDLGHCLGAFGHWALANGAKHYTGVDIQQSFCDKSKELLSKHWSDDKFTIERQETLEYLICSGHQTYDIVIASGIIHCYVNSIGFIEQLSNVAKEYVVIETQEADESSGIPAIQFKIFNMVSDSIGKPYAGWSSAVGFNAMRALMGENGFDLHGDRIYPKKIEGTHDAYNDDIQINVSEIYAAPKRYMARYRRTRKKITTSLQYNVLHNVRKDNPAYVKANQSNVTKLPKWEFDTAVASRFQEEAANNIPDYERVIDMCLDIANRRYDKESTIVDVGSALGHTIEKFNMAGYSDVYGVESSQAMRDNSKFKSFIDLSETFPKDWRANFVMANWTLHFVDERKQYIEDIYKALRAGGSFVLSDKTPQSDDIKEMYYEFKRSNGVSDEYIYEKEKKLQGYMNLLPIDWYLDTLKDVGFTNIQIINSRFGFVTFYCEKV
jgi:tRNA (cmo5U34)-methyltransferase